MIFLVQFCKKWITSNKLRLSCREAQDPCHLLYNPLHSRSSQLQNRNIHLLFPHAVSSLPNRCFGFFSGMHLLLAFYCSVNSLPELLRSKLSAVVINTSLFNSPESAWVSSRQTCLVCNFSEESKNAKTLQLLNNSVKNDNAHITEMEQKSLCASQEYPEAFLCAEFCYPMLILQLTSHTVINKCSKRVFLGFRCPGNEQSVSRPVKQTEG